MSIENDAAPADRVGSAHHAPKEPRLKEAPPAPESFEDRIGRAFDASLRPTEGSALDSGATFSRNASTSGAAPFAGPAGPQRTGLDETVGMLEAQRSRLDEAERGVTGLIRDREREIDMLRRALHDDRASLRDIHRARILVDAALRDSAGREG